MEEEKRGLRGFWFVHSLVETFDIFVRWIKSTNWFARVRNLFRENHAFSNELGASHSVLKSHLDKIVSGGYVGNTDTHRSPQNTQFLA